jgi:Domain of unknown function (DUF4157)/Prokaryotic homologs of the JAB domain
MRTFATKSEARPAATLVRSPLLRPLAINKPGDECEQEADRVSEQVMRMTKSEPLGEKGAARHAGQTSHAHSPVQTKWVESGRQEQAEIPPIVSEVLHSPGQPIDRATRAFVEPRFGHEFSQIRVHTDEKAADSARAMNALAYTSGRHLVFGAGQYSPATASGRRLLAHELTHSVQQGFGADPLAQSIGESGRALQRQAATAPGSPEEVTMRVRSPGGPAYGLRNKLQTLLDNKVANYIDYRDAIANARPAEKQFVLERRELLTSMRDALNPMSFARCVEGLGRRAPTFDELRNNKVVSEAIKAAWLASDIGANDRVAQAHEEGGWVFMNLIDGSLSIERAKAEGTDYLRVEPPPDVANGNVLVAIFHTHPHMGARTAFPSRTDLTQDARRGVPNLVAGTTGTKSDVYQVRRSGPAARKHLASDTKIPGSSGGVAP